MKFTRQQALWAIAAVVVIGVGVSLARRGTPVTWVQPTRGDLVQSIVTSGRVATASRSEIASPQNARIDAVAVKEGDVVKAGQIVVRLHSEDALAAQAMADAAVQEARLRLTQIQSVQSPVSEQQLAQTKAAARLAQQELERARSLVAQGFVSQSRLDDAERAAQTSQATVLAATAQAQSSRPGGVDVALATAKLEQALANQRASNDRLNQTRLVAPVSGTVVTRAAEVGDLALAGRSLLSVVSDGAFYLQASIDEKNMKWLRLGQTAWASADADPTRRFKATLNFIAPSVDPLRGTVDIKLQIDPSALPMLRPDMTVSIEIVIATAKDALKLPTDVVGGSAPDARYVWTVQDGVAQRSPVQLGLQGMGTTQIISGLKADDWVIVPDAAINLAPGDRVRAKAAVAPKTGGALPIPGLTN